MSVCVAASKMHVQTDERIDGQRDKHTHTRPSSSAPSHLLHHFHFFHIALCVFTISSRLMQPFLPSVIHEGEHGISL